MTACPLFRAVALTAAVTLASTLSSPSRAEPATADADDNARARSFYHNGIDALRAGKNEEAANALSEAWKLRKTYDVAASLAQAEIALKRYRDAAEHLDFCVSHFSPAESEQTLQQMKTALSDVRTHVGTLKIAVDHDGAEVLADGHAVGVSPLPAPTFVDPGAHTIQASLAGDKVSQLVTAEAGSEYPVTLKLGVTNSTPAADGTPNSTPAIATGVIAGAALIGGVVFLLETSHKATQRDERLAQLSGTNPCGAQSPAANAATCTQISSFNDDAKLFRTLSIVSFGATAAAGVATYLLWPRKPERPGLAMSAMVLPSRAGLDVFTGLHGTF